MRTLRQLWLVVRKNLLVRWRNKPLLFLELLWPLLIFTIVAIIRQATLPSSSGTCHFPPIALPSAGLVPFLQSLLCSLTAPCLNASAAQSPPQGRLNDYVQRLQPLRRDAGVSRAIRQLPSTIGLLASFQNGLKDPAVANLLSYSSRRPLPPPTQLLLCCRWERESG